MILVDTGPFVALFDPRDDAHETTAALLARVTEPLVTTVPVLTEVFHLLDPSTRGAAAVREFIDHGGCQTWFLSTASLTRAFALMRQYADHPMDLADASLVVAAETLRVTKIFTLDRRDFSTYRARMGRTLKRFTLLR